jgi:hypothetical protein
MAYTKTIWSTGDTITATLANHGETQYDEAIAEVDKRIQKLANNAFKANDPINRYPSSLSYFGIVGDSTYQGFPDYGTVQTFKGMGDNDTLFPRQFFYDYNSNEVRTRKVLATIKTAWAASTAYALNDLRMPTSAKENGIYYKCTTAGTSGSTEPAWPTTIGATVADGTAVWTAEGKFWSDWVQLLDDAHLSAADPHPQYKLDTDAPNAHKASHATGGSDALTPADIGAVNKAGDTMTGVLTISSATDGKLRLLASDSGTTAGTKEAGWNYIEFLDAQGDRQGYFGINNLGDFQFSPEVSGAVVKIGSNTVYHAGNDGVGSGLDADTVDGLHASDLQNFEVIDINGVIKSNNTLVSTGGSSYTLVKTVVINDTNQYRKVAMASIRFSIWSELSGAGAFGKSSYQPDGGSETFLPEHSTTGTTETFFTDSFTASLTLNQKLTARMYTKNTGGTGTRQQVFEVNGKTLQVKN